MKKKFFAFVAGMMICCMTTPVLAQWYEVSDKQLSADGKMLWCNYNYKSIDEQGEEIILSAYMQCGSSTNVTEGVLAEPLNQLVLSHHVTIFDPKEAPTAMKSERIDISMAGNHLFIVPDYQGFGVSADREQLYLIYDLSARQCYDALEAGKKLFDEEANVKLHSDWGLYLTGASQGASNAVATQRYLEQQDLDEQWRLKETLVADGPYCPSAMLESYMYDDTYCKNILMPMVLQLTIRALWTVYPEELAAYNFTDCFTESFQTVLQELAKGGNADEISKQLLANGPLNINTILSAEVLDKESALQKAVKACLAKNDLDLGWTPRHTMVGYACSNDDVIPDINNSRMIDAFGKPIFKALDYWMSVTLGYAMAPSYDVKVDNRHQLTCGLFLAYGDKLSIPYLLTLIPEQTAESLDAIQTITGDDCRYDLYGRPVESSRQGFSVKNGRVVFTR